MLLSLFSLGYNTAYDFAQANNKWCWKPYVLSVLLNLPSCFPSLVLRISCWQRDGGIRTNKNKNAVRSNLKSFTGWLWYFGDNNALFEEKPSGLESLNAPFFSSCWDVVDSNSHTKESRFYYKPCGAFGIQLFFLLKRSFFLLRNQANGVTIYWCNDLLRLIRIRKLNFPKGNCLYYDRTILETWDKMQHNEL